MSLKRFVKHNDGYTFKGESIMLELCFFFAILMPVKIPLKTLNRHGLIARDRYGKINHSGSFEQASTLNTNISGPVKETLAVCLRGSKEITLLQAIISGAQCH
jgi:hypothetical protein